RRGDAKSSVPNTASAGLLPSCGGLPAVCGDWARFCSLGRDGLPGLFQLFQDTPHLCRVDVDAGAHRARERDLPDVAALRCGRLRPDDLVDDGGVVLDELTLVEALLADRDVDVRPAVGAVLELAGLRVAHRLAHLEGDGAR